MSLHQPSSIFLVLYHRFGVGLTQNYWCCIGVGGGVLVIPKSPQDFVALHSIRWIVVGFSIIPIYATACCGATIFLLIPQPTSYSSTYLIFLNLPHIPQPTSHSSISLHFLLSIIPINSRYFLLFLLASSPKYLYLYASKTQSNYFLPT